MTLHGHNLIAGRRSAQDETTYLGVDPSTGDALPTGFHEATSDEIDQALLAASKAFRANRARSAEERAGLLEAIAEAILALDETLVDRMMAETGLPAGRVRGERGRTVGQLRLFAEVVREGSWVEARIDRAQPERTPVPKPDIRRMLVPLGPVVVFGASNFPLAFSVAGGDTASALAAGCPVVCKAHPAHPGTSELVGQAITDAVARTGFHPGTFSLLHATTAERSQELVRHPQTAAVGFTGSLRAGRAIFDAAAARSRPIPVYAEMGSVNPVFLLPGALAERGATLAEGYVGSLTLGVGQFCTNPGLVFGLGGEPLEQFKAQVEQHLTAKDAGTMLHAGIQRSYAESLNAARATEDVAVLATGASGDGATAAQASVLTTDAPTFLGNPHLHEEIFGPASLLIACGGPDELRAIARCLDGNLTATLHGTEADLHEHTDLVALLQEKVGRLIFNSFPTGVEVCPSMHHGGPYPATTDSRSTSVGTAAISRFARPLCFQGFPDATLPPELQDVNPRGVLRMVDGDYSRDAV